MCVTSDHRSRSLRHVRALLSSDLSRNELSGPLPPWLAGLPALRFVNLSHNRLSGAIPLSFADANVLEVVCVGLCRHVCSGKLQAPSDSLTDGRTDGRTGVSWGDLERAGTCRQTS